jgi:hypothetical protein
MSLRWAIDGQHLSLSNSQVTSYSACMCVPRLMCLWEFIGCVLIQFISFLCWCCVGYWNSVFCVFCGFWGRSLC